jgi:hypothetical protein
MPNNRGLQKPLLKATKHHLYLAINNVDHVLPNYATEQIAPTANPKGVQRLRNSLWHCNLIMLALAQIGPTPLDAAPQGHFAPEVTTFLER